MLPFYATGRGKILRQIALRKSIKFRSLRLRRRCGFCSYGRIGLNDSSARRIILPAVAEGYCADMTSAVVVRVFDITRVTAVSGIGTPTVRERSGFFRISVPQSGDNVARGCLRNVSNRPVKPAELYRYVPLVVV